MTIHLLDTLVPEKLEWWPVLQCSEQLSSSAVTLLNWLAAAAAVWQFALASHSRC